MRRALLLGGVLVALGVAGAAVAYVVYDRAEPEDVRGSPTVEFASTEAPGATTRPEPEVREEPWPTYGFDPQRTRFAPEFALRPPLRRVWTVRGRTLIEFPPVVAYDRVYFGTNAGLVIAARAEDGEVAWREDTKRCIAASPAVGDDVLYVSLMDPYPCAEHDQDAPGFVVALDADSGEELWRFRAGVNESSPLLVDGILYFGTWDRRVYALDVETRKPVWTFETGDKVKGGAAFARGTVYIGSYDGKLYALDARTGELRWDSEAQGGLRGPGNFYATPAVAYGRVYIGNTDGKVYAFGARSGELLWAQSTGNYVYSSAAVWNRTVYVGSHDEELHALDAATGDERWTFAANGPISGSPTVLAGVVYFSTTRGRTYALDARTGDELWAFPDGQYTPVVADRERLYVTGHTRVHAFVPQ